MKTVKLILITGRYTTMGRHSPAVSAKRARVAPSISSTSGDHTARERLVLAAASLFTRKGYAATTVREIVTAAGVTKPVLYYYFQNKEGIYLELMRTPFQKFDSLLDASRGRKGSPSERILFLSDQIFSMILDNLEAARLMTSIYYGPPQGAPFFDFDTYHFKLHDVFRRLVKEGILQGEFQKGNVDDRMWAIVGLINVAMESQLCHPEIAIDRKQLARILHLILKGMSAGNKKGKARIT
jgi:AcrR family transcriptional regulator